MEQDVCELAHLADGIIESRLELLDHCMTFLILRLRLLGRGRCSLTLLRRFLHRSELLAGGVDVSDRASDLADLLIIGVLTLNLVLKVLLQLLVLQLNLFQLMLQHGHVLLLFEKFLSHLGKGALLILLHLLHSLIDLVLPVVQLLIRLFQVDETAA